MRRPQYIIAATMLTASIAGNAAAETFRFPAERVNLGVAQVDIAISVYMFTPCVGRWSMDYPAGFVFTRTSANGGGLSGNPGRGSYDVAIKTQECRLSSDYVEPARTYWHKVVVY